LFRGDATGEDDRTGFGDEHTAVGNEGVNAGSVDADLATGEFGFDG
jgi:hypothetical protein